MKRGEHLYLIECNLSGGFVLKCACGLTFSIGDTYDETSRSGKVTHRKIGNLNSARKAHLIHYLSDEAKTVCDHDFLTMGVTCPKCGDPLWAGALEVDA